MESDGNSSPAKVRVAPMAANALHDAIEQQVAFISQLLPILKADQREKLALSMDKPWMGRGHDDDDDD